MTLDPKALEAAGAAIITAMAGMPKDGMTTARIAEAAITAYLSAHPAGEPVGWIVANDDETKWRCWKDGFSAWTDNRDAATRYARREDAEAVHSEDIDAWYIRPYGNPATARDVTEPASFQDGVAAWMQECFGAEVSGDRLERGDRLLEEVFELLQASGYPRERIRALDDYTFSRPVGQLGQEVGGVMVTLAAFCAAHGVEMAGEGNIELARVWTKIDVIRAKQASKPHGSALPVAMPAPSTARDAVLEEAAKWVEARRDEYMAEHGAYDPDTGVTEFPGNGDEYVGELEEIIDGIRALKSASQEGK